MFKKLLARKGIQEYCSKADSKKYSLVNKALPFGAEERFEYEFLMIHYLQTLSPALTGEGFTPVISSHPDDSINGLNCLGKAIILGTLIKELGYVVRLGIMPDHAAVIFTHNEQHYYCDIQNIELKLLHGTFTQHEEYEWYVSSEDDKMLFRLIAIHDFEKGIVNAIFENFAYLKALPSMEVLTEDQKSMAAINRKEFSFAEKINCVDWAAMQTAFFAGLNAYKHHYESDFVLECERILKRRFIRSLVVQFDAITVNAFERATGEKNCEGIIRKFHATYLEAMIDAREEIMWAIESRGVFVENIPLVLQKYFTCIAQSVAHNADLKEYTLIVIRRRLFDTVIIS